MSACSGSASGTSVAGSMWLWMTDCPLMGAVSASCILAIDGSFGPLYWKRPTLSERKKSLKVIFIDPVRGCIT